MKHSSNWQFQLQYRFDRLLEKGAGGLFIWLLVLTIAFVLFISVVVALYTALADGVEPVSFANALLASLRRMFALVPLTGEESAFYTVKVIIVSLIGLLLFAMLNATLTLTLIRRFEYLNLGKTKVLERDHTLILGWSPTIFALIDQLLLEKEASGNQGKLVVLASMPKLEMEGEIREKATHPQRKQVICRCGNPADASHVSIAAPETARRVIILPPQAENADTLVLKALLAVASTPASGPRRIIVALQQADNMRLAQIIGGESVTAVNLDDILPRLTVQTSLYSGLSNIYAELLNYRGVEIYFHKIPQLQGSTFAKALLYPENASVIGVRKSKSAFLNTHDPDPYLRKSERMIVLNPPPDYLIEQGDQLIAISTDGSVFDPARYTPAPSKPFKPHARTQDGEALHVLIFGWNPQINLILTELNQYAQVGSVVEIHTDYPLDTEWIASADRDLNRLNISACHYDLTSRQELEKIRIRTFDHVIILKDQHAADTRTMTTLIHLRDIARERHAHFSLVCQMDDTRIQSLVETPEPDDFILSDRLAALILSQLAGNPELYAVFEELFDTYGCRIVLQPAEWYFGSDEVVPFGELIHRAYTQREIAIGYRYAVSMTDPSANFGIRLNPKKSDIFTVRSGDRLILIREE